MGYLKEYIDRGVQTSCFLQSTTISSDLAAVGVPQVPFDDRDSRPLSHEITIKLPSVDPERSPSPSSVDDNSAYSRSNLQHSPVSPMCAPSISRHVPRRKLFLVERRPEGKSVERRVISMPDDMSPQHVKLDSQNGMRVVSMPEYLAAAVDLSLDSVELPSAGASFGSSYFEKRHRVRVYPPPSDLPHTPSPPSSPESILIIDSHAQLPDGFLRRRYSKKTASPGNGWMTWASSPPRPIPALHGPLSLPYARCPSGAEGTIIEEPGNVSRMIWGLGQDESCQYRGDSEHTDDETRHSVAFPNSQVTPQTQKRRVPQKPSQVRAVVNNKKTFKGAAGGKTSTSHHPDHEPRIHGHSQAPRLHESKAEPVSRGLPLSGSWRSETGIPTVRELEAHETNVGSSFNDQKLLSDLQLAFARQSLQNTTLNQTYPEGLKPVFPVSNHHRATPAYPKIFVEPRLNEVVNAVQYQSAIEIAQQYRQYQEFRLKQQAGLPTPPSSSSPQWSSNFSPYQYPSVSPEMDGQNTLGLPHHTQQTQHPFLDASHQAGLLYNRRDNNVATHLFDGNGGCDSMLSRHDRDVPSAVNRRSSNVSGGLSNYLRDSQALSTQQPHYASTTELPLTPAACYPINTGRTIVSVAPPSPESPGSRSRSISYQQPRSVPLARLIQRRLSSVPEEELNSLANTSSASAYRFTDCHQRGLSSRDYSDDNTTPSKYHQELHLMIPAASHMSVPSLDSVDECEARPYSFPHEASPAKVRLPSAQEQEYPSQSRIKSRPKGGGAVDTSQQLKKKLRGRKIRNDTCSVSTR
ncbi:hypothetical protein BDR07DRAFT_1605689 [Suillus spraguei]|nr:hypothetical protein BDR07DRAFT_1605689 [Suillus spraguei]